MRRNWPKHNSEYLHEFCFDLFVQQLKLLTRSMCLQQKQRKLGLQVCGWLPTYIYWLWAVSVTPLLHFIHSHFHRKVLQVSTDSLYQTESKSFQSICGKDLKNLEFKLRISKKHALSLGKHTVCARYVEAHPNVKIMWVCVFI